MLRIFSRQTDSLRSNYEIPAPAQYRRIYRSPESPLKNRFEVWQHQQQKQVVISVRGTVQNNLSWLENFYAAMTPATGSFALNDSTTFTYKLAVDSAATVHIGWLIGLASMAADVKARIAAAHQQGIRQVILFGHSQGAAITFLLRSYLHYEAAAGRFPTDLQIKTYCSAAPKPGNMDYVYDFDAITRNGWALTVVNGADWVPQTPFSVQTLDDFPPTNPFVNVSGALRKQPLLVRLYLASSFRKMKKATRKAQQRFEKYLGKMVGKQVQKAMSQLVPPPFTPVNNYHRAGTPVVLLPDAGYWQLYPEVAGNVFTHHLLQPYYYLAPQGEGRKAEKWY